MKANYALCLLIFLLIISTAIAIDMDGSDDCDKLCWKDNHCDEDECVSYSGCKMCDPITCALTCLSNNRPENTTCNDNSQCAEGLHCSGAKRAVSYQRACCPEDSEWDYLKESCEGEEMQRLIADETESEDEDDVQSYTITVGESCYLGKCVDGDYNCDGIEDDLCFASEEVCGDYIDNDKDGVADDGCCPSGSCYECGYGLFNLCDREECESLGDCIYEPGFLSLFFKDCYLPSCVQDMCISEICNDFDDNCNGFIDENCYIVTDIPGTEEELQVNLQVIDCVMDNECEENQECRDNECVDIEVQDEGCQENNDCEDDEVCNNNQCEKAKVVLSFVPYNWEGDLVTFDDAVDKQATFFLQKFPISDCREKVRVNSFRSNPISFEPVCTCSDLRSIEDNFLIETGYMPAMKQTRHFIIGMSNAEICDDTIGFSCGNTIIYVEKDFTVTTAHEIGHEYSLSDQYNKLINSEPNLLSDKYGCDPEGSCCYKECTEDPVTHHGNICCKGNLARNSMFGRSIMSHATAHNPRKFDVPSYEHLKIQYSLNCEAD